MDMIVYTLVSKGGGVDGLDSSDKGGKVTHAFTTRLEAEKSKALPWSTLEPIVIDADKVAKEAIAKLSPVERLFVVPYATLKRYGFA